MIFYKCQANQNDFIFIEKKFNVSFSSLAKKFCHRRSSIGADGLVTYSIKKPYYFRFYNPNGQESAMCGNALISYPALLNYLGIKLSKKIGIKTATGLRELTILERKKCMIQSILDMEQPSFKPQEISKYMIQNSMKDYPLTILDRTFMCNFVSLGNPHCVIFVDETVDIETYGPLIENHPLFSEKINVEFVQIKSRNELSVDFWERGAGHTYSCGSGSCAAFVVALQKKLCNSSVHINKKTTSIQTLSKNNHVFIKSTGYFVFEGKI